MLTGKQRFGERIRLNGNLWVGDVGRPILQILPFPPFVATNSGLVLMNIFGAAPVPNPFTYGTRAAV